MLHKITQRILSFFLALLFCLTLMPTLSFAAIPKAYVVSFYALDGVTIVHRQNVADGQYIDGSNHELYNSWSTSEALTANYMLPANWEAVRDILFDLDTSIEFNWKQTPIIKNYNVTLAVIKHEPEPAYCTVGFRLVNGYWIIGYAQQVKAGESINWDKLNAEYPWSEILRPQTDLLFWCYDDTGNPMWDPNTPIIENLILFPKFKDNVQITVIKAIPSAFVTKLSGNTNDLTITVTEELSDGTINIITEKFSIKNNSDGTFKVGKYNVYVATSGNVKIKACELAGDQAKTQLLYQGHGSFRIIAKDGTVIYVDPYAGDGYDMPADIILVTHQHSDHNQLQLVTQNPGCIIISNFEALEGEKYNNFKVGNIKIKSVEATNERHDPTLCVGFIITVDDITIYAAGDTSKTDQMSSFAALKIDYALLPCDGIYNMGLEEAAECAKIIKAKNNIPIHIKPGALFDQELADQFYAPNRLIIPAGTEIDLVKK